MIFDPETARPLVVMEAAYVSALRTASVSMAAMSRLTLPGVDEVALIGCGTLAKAHLAVLPSSVTTVRLFDLDRGRATALADALRAGAGTAHLRTVVADDVESCVRGTGLVIPVTTVTEGYLPYAWLEPGSVLIHVSLDDVLPDVVHQAEAVFVDDWGLVSQDPRRLLGRMFRSGDLLAPDGSGHPGVPARPGARRVDATIGEVLLGTHPGRRTDSGVILVNPFGMSILDIAFGSAVYEQALELELGTRLPI
jgi:ornithine cyclodeaminase